MHATRVDPSVRRRERGRRAEGAAGASSPDRRFAIFLPVRCSVNNPPSRVTIPSPRQQLLRQQDCVRWQRLTGGPRGGRRETLGNATPQGG